MTTLEQQCEQIARAHIHAEPKADNPAWMNCHHDCGVLLLYINQLKGELAGYASARDVWEIETERLKDRIRRLEGAVT